MSNKNRIVIDYQGEEKLVLLAAMENHTGNEIDIQNEYYKQSFEVVKKYEEFKNIKDFKSLQQLNTKNKEGFVIKFDHGLRIKIKFDDYVKLHRIVTGISTKSIWECLRQNIRLEEYLANIPDEFYQWAKVQEQILKTKYQSVEDSARFFINNIQKKNLPMKDVANEINQMPNSSGILFAMYKNKPYSDLIWKILEPTFEKPFQKSTEG